MYCRSAFEWLRCETELQQERGEGSGVRARRWCNNATRTPSCLLTHLTSPDLSTALQLTPHTVLASPQTRTSPHMTAAASSSSSSREELVQLHFIPSSTANALLCSTHSVAVHHSGDCEHCTHPLRTDCSLRVVRCVVPVRLCCPPFVTSRQSTNLYRQASWITLKKRRLISSRLQPPPPPPPTPPPAPPLPPHPPPLTRSTTRTAPLISP